MPLDIDVTRAAFVSETKRGGTMGSIGWNSSEMDNVREALGTYHKAIGADAKSAARNELISALFVWKRDKPNEFAKRNTVSGGLVLKLCVQCGLDDYRPPPCPAVQFHGNARRHPTVRLVPRVTPLNRGIGAELARLVKDNQRPALVIIDLYGDDFAAQGMNSKFGDAPVSDHIFKLMNATSVNDREHPRLVPTYVCAKNVTPKGSELNSIFGTALWESPTLISSKHNSVLTGTPLLAGLREKAITHVFVTGFDANMCVAASIFGTGTVGDGYEPGFLDYGFDVITSRFVLASGGRPLRAQDGWPYMGPHA